MRDVAVAGTRSDVGKTVTGLAVGPGPDAFAGVI